MYAIRARNVNEALQIGAMAINAVGKRGKSRNGDVIAFDEPVSTEYRKPQEKVLFFPERDANPFFHFFEALWMLAGRDDLAFVQQFNKRMGEYSDDGKTLNGSAYGKRWRNHFINTNSSSSYQLDQLDTLVRHIKEDYNNRRCVLSMWDAADDLDNQGSKDLPCNLQVAFRPKEHDKSLHIMVTNRSNDMVWGAYGANAVQFGTLLEYIAGKTGLTVGTYHQVSNNFHVYADNPVWQRCQHLRTGLACYYEMGIVKPYQLMDHADSFDDELREFLNNPEATINWRNSLFPLVAKPLWDAWNLFKNERDFERALRDAAACAATDWALAAIEWLTRRKVADESKQAA